MTMGNTPALRIGVAFFYHESHSFSPLKTGLDSFVAEDHHQGEEILDVYAHTSTELGGFLSILERRGAVAVPLTAAAAMPSGEVTQEAHDTLRQEFVDKLSKENTLHALDGLLIALHGSMVAENEQDPEGAIIRIAREVLGPEVPIAVTFDLHANMSAAPA
jgi:microcystin degradation protein MlrC